MIVLNDEGFQAREPEPAAAAFWVDGESEASGECAPALGLLTLAFLAALVWLAEVLR